jgi:hypothetical protein
MDYRQSQGGVSFLFSNRWQNQNAAVFDLKRCLAYIALLVSDLDAMQPFDPHLIHFIGDRMITIDRQTVDTGSYEMRSDLLRLAKELKDVTFTIANVNTSCRITEKIRRLLRIFQPSDALLLFDRNPRRIDFLLEGITAFEFLSRPEFDGGKSEWKTVGCYDET